MTTDWLSALVPRGTIPPRARVATDAAVIDLAGRWDFSYTPGRGTPPEPWTTIEVPGCWQLQGHGSPVYLSAQFPFALDPPHVPDANAIGVYRRTVDVPDGFQTAVLRCDGIDATGEVSVDGVVLGWTKGSRLTHEFPVSLQPGVHTLEIRVAQFSATSYVEDQDMFWLSGIFRDVALAARPDAAIEDLVVVADYDPRTGHGILDLAVVTTGEVDARLEGRPVDTGVTDVGPVEPWTAETPRLYDLVVRTTGETAHLRVGFRRVAIEGGLLTVNGRPIRFRGVNRHDTDPDRGRTVTQAQVREDLLAMKRAGLNAVRTSHYPPLPCLLDLADDLGLYVLEECDIETHAFVLDEWRRNPSDDPAWRDAYLDRTERMVRRDRHHPSVVMWSLGNEAGAGENFLATRDWIHATDPTRPVHYERDPSYAPSDVVSLMYPEIERLAELATGDEHPGKPVILCEYAHAMGAGPGGLTEYEALFDAHPRLQGGFVWEWRDHTLRLPSGRLGYGGDFGEPLHDGAFAADGLHDGDGRPTPGLADYAAVIAPVRLVVSRGWDALVVGNRYDHVDLTDIRLTWTVESAAGLLAAGELATPQLSPRSSCEILLPTGEHLAPGRVLTVSARTRSDQPWAPAGHEVGSGQGAVGLDRGSPAPASSSFADGVAFSDLGDLAGLPGLTVAGPRLGLWRAPTDNDRGLAMRSRGQVPDEERWREANLAHLSRRTGAVEVASDRVRVETWTAPYSRSFGVRSTWDWTPVVGGVALDAVMEPYGEWQCPWARAGLDWWLPGMDADAIVRWQGLGPGRAGSDVGQAARCGWHAARVADWQVPHARPQDDGVRAGVTWLSLALPDGRTLRIDSLAPLVVSVRPWTDAELARAEHPDELPESSGLVVSLNAAVHGYGTGACGPGVSAAHVLRPSSQRLRISITIG